MPELEILEAKVPVRTPRLVREPEYDDFRFDTPLATWFNGPVFSRARDIFAANMTELLDRAEDPARMIRMIILEMEETLVELRASAARSIADVKEMRRAIGRLDELQLELDRQGRAGAVEGPRGPCEAGSRRAAEGGRHGRRPALGDGADRAGPAQLRGGHRQASGKLREARARQNAIAARIESAVARAKAREVMHGSRTLDAFAKFEVLERRADFAEGRADALGLTGPKSLEEEIAELQAPTRRSTPSWKP